MTACIFDPAIFDAAIFDVCGGAQQQAGGGWGLYGRRKLRQVKPPEQPEHQVAPDHQAADLTAIHAQKQAAALQAERKARKQAQEDAERVRIIGRLREELRRAQEKQAAATTVRRHAEATRAANARLENLRRQLAALEHQQRQVEARARREEEDAFFMLLAA